MRTVPIVVALVLVVGCSAAPPPTPIVIYVTPPPAEPTAGVVATHQPPEVTPSAYPVAENTPRPSPSPTPRPTLAAPPVVSADVGAPVMLVSSEYGSTTAAIVVEVKNTGEAWIELNDFSGSWTIYNPDGAVLDTGPFIASAPRIIGPGETGYAIGFTFSNRRASAFNRVEAHVDFDESDEEVRTLSVENVRTSRYRLLRTTRVTGEVRNGGADTAESISVIVLLRDDRGQIIGAGWELIDRIPPGQKRAFSATSLVRTPFRHVADTEVHASPLW
jgi:hypothetical protein